MFHRHDNMKRTIALLGIVFTLLSGSPNQHIFCSIAEGGSGHVIISCHRQGSFTSDACPHSHGCLKIRSKKTKLETISSLLADCGQARCIKNQGRPCPCPSNCWCHQTPDPLGMPKGTVAGVVFEFSGTVHWVAASHVMTECDLGPLTVRAPTDVFSADSATSRCTQLCRFLI